jgi:hypothetical protein
MADAPKRILVRDPYNFPSRIGTFGTNLVNGGAIAAGNQTQFPDSDFNNSLDAPFRATRIKFFVGRVAGGDEVDSDYNEVLIRITATLRDQKLVKSFGALSVLCDRQRREYLLEPATLLVGNQNGGISLEVQVQAGAWGAPYNVSANMTGFFERYADVTESMVPQGGPRP